MAKNKIHHIKEHVEHAVEKFENPFDRPIPKMQMPEIMEIQFEMPEFAMPQFDFGMQQQNIWAAPPMAQFGMPEFTSFHRPNGFNLF